MGEVKQSAVGRRNGLTLTGLMPSLVDRLTTHAIQKECVFTSIPTDYSVARIRACYNCKFESSSVGDLLTS
jgi:hypothetical protein